MMTLLALIYVIFVGQGLPASVLGSLWPQMQGDLGAAMALAGYLSMATTAGTALASIAVHRVVRRFGVGKTAAGGVLLVALSLTGFGAAPGTAALFFCAFFMGLGTGAVDAAINHFVAVHYAAQHMNWLHCFWGLGAALGPVLLSAVLRAGGSWRLGFWILAGLLTLLFAAILHSLPRWNQGEIWTMPEHLKQAETGGGIRKHGLVPLLGTFLLYNATEATAGLWGASYVHQMFALDPARAAVTSTLFFGALTAGRLISGAAAMKLSGRSMIRLGLAVASAGAVGTAAAGSLGWAWAGICLMGLGLAPVFPSLLHATPKIFGVEASQKVMGLEMACAYAGSTFFPPLLGALTEHFGLKIYPWYLLICLLATVLFWEAGGLLRKSIENNNL